MRKVVTLAVAVALLAAACHKDSFTLEGTLENGAGKTLYIEELTPNGPLFIDSLRLDENGRFKFEYRMPYVSFYNLHATESNYVMLLPDYGEKIKLTGDVERLETSYEVRGSQGSQLLWQLQAFGNDGNERLKEIVALDHENRQRFSADPIGYDEAKQITDSLYWDNYQEQSEYVKQFIEEHSGNLATLIALYKPLGRDHALIDINRNPELLEYYDKVLEGLQEAMPDNPHTVHFKNSVARLHHLYEQYQERQEAVITMGNE